MNWQTTTLIEWVKQNPQLWQNDIIRNWQEDYPTHNSDIGFFTTLESESRGDVDVRHIVGQWNHYEGQPWIDALLKPKCNLTRMRYNIDKFDMEGAYYFDDAAKDIYFNTLDGRCWYSNRAFLQVKFA